MNGSFIVQPDETVLITGATGFIGPALIESLLQKGFRNLRAFVRPSSDFSRLEAVARSNANTAYLDVVRGNLLSRDDCLRATEGAAVVFHLATSGDKSFPDAYLNSVVTTRNLIESSLQQRALRRFVNVSSFAVYDNSQRGPLDETAPLEQHPESCGDAYSFAKLMQEEVVADYGKRFDFPFVNVRPGSVYGPGKRGITGRVGVDTFGIFLHLGGSNRIPFTYIENCADAIALSGLIPGVDGETFNVVDDSLPSSRRFLRLYKRNVAAFRSIYIPSSLSYGLCWLWERYSSWSHGQLPPAFNRRRWRVEWKSTRYSNAKIKARLGWKPRVATDEGLKRYFSASRGTQDA